LGLGETVVGCQLSLRRVRAGCFGAGHFAERNQAGSESQAPFLGQRQRGQVCSLLGQCKPLHPLVGSPIVGKERLEELGGDPESRVRNSQSRIQDSESSRLVPYETVGLSRFEGFPEAAASPQQLPKAFETAAGPGSLRRPHTKKFARHAAHAAGHSTQAR
jgi:hypothetical protein